MTKFFIRKEAATPGVATAPGVAQALPDRAYNNPGQPSWWEKPLYALQRAVPFSYAKPTSQKMFDPKDDPAQYHADVYNMAKARDERYAVRHENNLQRLSRLNKEIRKYPWRQLTLAPISRACRAAIYAVCPRSLPRWRNRVAGR